MTSEQHALTQEEIIALGVENGENLNAIPDELSLLYDAGVQGVAKVAIKETFKRISGTEKELTLGDDFQT